MSRYKAIGPLEEMAVKKYLAMGHTVKDACYMADVKVRTWNDYCVREGITKEELDQIREHPTRMAKTVVVEDIVENKNVITAKWWLEHKASDEFNTKVEQSVTVKPELSMEDKQNALMEYMKQFVEGEHEQGGGTPGTGITEEKVDAGEYSEPLQENND